MNKEHYKQIMEHIQMPDACEQKILKQVEAAESDTITVPRRRTWKRNVCSGIAVAACIGVAGMATVSATQGTDWIQALFPSVTQERELLQYTEQQSGNVSAFSAELEGLDAELVSAFADENNLYYALRLTQKAENPEQYGTHFNAQTGEHCWIDGQIPMLTGGASGTSNADGSCLLVEKIHLEDAWDSGSVYEREINVYGWDSEEEITEYGCIGKISITIDLQAQTEARTCDVSGRWECENGYLDVEQVAVQPLALTIYGKSHIQELEHAPKDVRVILKDGSTVSGSCKSYGCKNDGECTAEWVDVEYFLYLDTLVDPGAVVAVQLDDVTIPLDDAEIEGRTNTNAALESTLLRIP